MTVIRDLEMKVAELLGTALPTSCPEKNQREVKRFHRNTTVGNAQISEELGTV